MNFARQNGNPSVKNYWHSAADALKVLLRSNPKVLNPQPAACIKRVNDSIKRTGKLQFCTECEVIDTQCEANACLKESLKVCNDVK